MAKSEKFQVISKEYLEQMVVEPEIQKALEISNSVCRSRSSCYQHKFHQHKSQLLTYRSSNSCLQRDSILVRKGEFKSIRNGKIICGTTCLAA